MVKECPNCGEARHIKVFPLSDAFNSMSRLVCFTCFAHLTILGTWVLDRLTSDSSSK